MTLSLRFTKEIKKIAEEFNGNNGDKILTEIKKSINSKNYKDSTKISAYFSIRKLLEETIKDKDFLNSITPPKELIESRNLVSDARRRNRETIKINKEDIKKILKLGDSEDLYDRVIYYLLLTGSRTQELLNKSMYSPIEGSDNKLKVEGLLKKKPNTSDEGVITLLLGDPKDISVKIDKIQNDFTDRNIAIKGFQRSLLRRVKKIIPNITPHGLRAIHANWLWKFRRGDSKERYNSFISTALNHENDLSSLNYTYINLDNINEDILNFSKEEKDESYNISKMPPRKLKSKKENSEQVSEPEQEQEQELLQKSNPVVEASPSNIHLMTNKALKSMAKSRGYRGYSKMNKPELLKLLSG